MKRSIILPMIGDLGGLDIEGNHYGTDSDSINDDHLISLNQTNPFDHGSGLDDW